MKNNKTQWSVGGNDHFMVEHTHIIEDLDNCVYVLEKMPNGPMYLSKRTDSFKFPYKVYGIQTDFIDRVVKTYNHTKGNIGILLNGIKGTGKTVTGELICNKIGLPIIIVKRTDSELVKFFSSIKQDILIYVDEFEKVFEKDNLHRDTSEEILTLMDGVLNTEFRRVFLFTTNNLFINDNLLSRPGRIRYKKEFGNLNKKAVSEIVDDMLLHKDMREQIMQYVGTLKIITVDIVKTLVEEVNIHVETPEKFKDFFNVVEVDSLYDVYVGPAASVGLDKMVKQFSGALISPNIFDKEINVAQHIGSYLTVNSKPAGVIRHVHDNVLLLEVNMGEDKKKEIELVQITLIKTMNKYFV